MNYKKLVKEGTFLHSYLEHCHTLETPVAYDFWSGMWLLSLALGRRVVVNRPRIPVFLNTYVILVSESGVTRKSTAVAQARNLMMSVREEVLPHGILLTKKLSPERLIRAMQESSMRRGSVDLVICVSELMTALGREPYMKHMPGMLTDLYDCPSIHEQPGMTLDKKLVMRDVYVSLFAATTPSSFYKTLNRDVIEGGFASRCLFVRAEKPKRSVPWPEEVNDVNANRGLGSVLSRISTNSRNPTFQAIDLHPRALAHFKRWYNRRSPDRDPYVASFQSREDDHILRTAALLSINDGEWKIDARHVRSAISLIEEVRESSRVLFGVTGRNKDKIVRGVERLREELVYAGVDGMFQSALFDTVRSYFKGDEFRLLLEIMHELGLVQRFDIRAPGRRGPTKRLWRATDAIETPNLMELILDEYKDAS